MKHNIVIKSITEVMKPKRFVNNIYEKSFGR